MTDPGVFRTYERLLAAQLGEAARTSCLQPEQIQALVEHRGAEGERLSRLAHVMGCPHCLREFEILRVLRSGVTEAAKQRTRRLGLRAMIVLAAIAVVSLGVVAVVRPRAAELRPVAPVGRVAAGIPVVLTWRAFPGAVSYRAELRNDSGSMLYAAWSLDTTLALPDSVLLAPGARYVWSLRAQLGDSALRLSTPTPFEVAPR